MSGRAWTSAGLSIVAVWGLILGLALSNVAALVMAWFAFLLMLWHGAHDPRRWDRSHLEDRERLP